MHFYKLLILHLKQRAHTAEISQENFLKSTVFKLQKWFKYENGVELNFESKRLLRIKNKDKNVRSRAWGEAYESLFKIVFTSLQVKFSFD